MYYLLTREVPVNFLHRVASDDTHVLVEGGPVDYFVFHEGGRAEKVTLGRDHEAGERLVVAVPAGAAKALRLHGREPATPSWSTCSRPAWTPDRVKLGAGPEFVAWYQDRAPWATPQLLRELIGPNLRS